MSREYFEAKYPEPRYGKLKLTADEALRQTRELHDRIEKLIDVLSKHLQEEPDCKHDINEIMMEFFHK